ncbi:right-handed parallel beta-helix repeat-containing protein [Bacillus sp. UMB0728]|uniref:right-handed parallel beta-helix repeat-containing protein n=1 Tax=Bacillus sp. UMB0728 TaxID=2066052 RepID=UPI0015DEC7F8|nr:right-handed parallel beta-helix repeat-containing protein [Bacillus sp. UMB0728]
MFVIKDLKGGNKLNVTKESHFHSSDPEVAAVGPTGVVTAIMEGEVQITASYKNIKKILKIKVLSQMNQISVKDFGAIGDGRSDDTAAFQKAINNLSANGGGNLFVPSGTYSLHPIFLEPHVNLVGASQDSVIMRLSDDVPVGQRRLINMNDYTKVENITCDGNKGQYPNGTEHMHCIFAYDSDHIVIDHNRLINAVGDGISISGSKNSSDFVVITNNIVEENQRAQIVIEQVNHVKILNNIITSHTGSSTIHFEPWEDMKLSDADISGNKLTSTVDGNCVLLRGSDSEQTKIAEAGNLYYGIEFYNNYVSCPSGVFLIQDSLGAKIYNNELNVRNIHVWRKNQEVKIYQNEITSEVGVMIEGGSDGRLVSTGTEIKQNTFNTLNEGILIQAGTEETKILQNKFTGKETMPAIKLFASNDLEDITIASNDFKGYEKGVYFEYYGDYFINDVKILNNVFVNIKSYASLIKGPVHQVVIAENEIKDSSGVYLHVHEGRPMSDIVISNNKVTDGEEGIIVEEYGRGSLNGLTISKNYLSGLSNGGSYAAIDVDFIPDNLKITENELINNDNNKISYPVSLKKEVKRNKISE